MICLSAFSTASGRVPGFASSLSIQNVTAQILQVSPFVTLKRGDSDFGCLKIGGRRFQVWSRNAIAFVIERYHRLPRGGEHLCMHQQHICQTLALHGFDWLILGGGVQSD
jgi:hypothetical protein